MALPLLGMDARKTRANALVAFALALAMSMVLSGCFLTPAVNVGDYRNKAGNSAQAMVSAINSARLAVQLELEDRTTSTVTDDLVADAESDASSVVTAFESRQPPTHAALALMQRVDDPLQAASADLTALRISVREGDERAIHHDLRSLAEPLAKLNKLEQLHS